MSGASSNSLLTTLEQAIGSFRAEQREINDSIQLYREILHSITPLPKTVSDESEGAEAADTNTSPTEKEDMELLERALEKALQVRTGSGRPKKDPVTNGHLGPRQEPDSSAQMAKHAARAQSTSKSAGSGKKEHRKPGPSVSAALGSGPSVGPHRGQPKATKKDRSIIQKGPVSCSALERRRTEGELRQAGSGSDSQHGLSTLPSEIKSVESHACGAQGLPRNDGISSDQITHWKSLRNKQERLWDKVISVQSNSVPGRANFKERMSAMFPVGCGGPDGSGAPADEMTHSGPDLAHHCRTTVLLAKPPREVAPESESEAGDQWRSPAGCLDVLHDRRVSPLPLTITYTTEAELLELETLRMRVALLQQEMQLEQVLLDTLSPQLASITPGPGGPAPSVLRDVFSLLGEGGERFPATVLDCDSD